MFQKPMWLGNDFTFLLSQILTNIQLPLIMTHITNSTLV